MNKYLEEIKRAYKLRKHVGIYFSPVSPECEIQAELLHSATLVHIGKSALWYLFPPVSLESQI